MPGDLDSEVAAAPNSPIKCIYWNVRSISGKKNVKHFQHYIKEKQVDLLFLSETWQRQGHHLPELLGYELISCMSEHGRGYGGVACYFKQEYSPYITSCKNDPQGHYLWLKLDKALGFEKYLFAAVCYFPPTTSTVYKDRGHRLSEPNFPYTNLSNDISSFSMNRTVCDFFVVGDFNSRIGDVQAPEAHRQGLSRESADKKINNFGLPLMDVCSKNDLLICNGVREVWPKSGETTCRSKSVVDYILAPVSRARFLVKDIEILPLEKKSDHNAINFTLWRPRPLLEAAQLNTSIEEELRCPSSGSMSKSLTEAPNQTSRLCQCATTAQKALKTESPRKPSSELAIGGNKEGCTGQARIRGRERSPKSVNLMSSDNWETNSDREGPLEHSGSPSFLSHERGLAELGSIRSAEWFEAKTSRLLNKILIPDGLTQQTFPNYMTKLASVFSLDKRVSEHMTINSQRPSVASPRLVHVTRLCVCGDTLSRGLQIDHLFKGDTYTRSITAVEPSRFATLLKNLKSAYDSGKLWQSITQFKVARKFAKAIR